MLDLSDYKFGLYPNKPVKPFVNSNGNSAYFNEIANKFKEYELNLEKYEAEVELWKSRRDVITAQFKEDCFDYFELRNNVRGEKIYKLAVILGNGDTFGFEDIFNRLEIICDILES